ncbi:glycosyltransferase family 8 protein [Helicobacter mustelae]|uniref:Putative lipopolysaccharide 1,3-galactosyltransferase n=1 Tax=Helicobacter mustelae (strain ATCC 43772 / CCUG 25715 / CIP 103759 / LMG 18044 / NCTC 12198 / R85-136P) TaxID=679897 RepID=D3UIL5_HELM1|nr:glycosyltransferase family 8 protein [Helicobacter mustelae]CBG40340.1 putative lipopolysaccharide 1,3-galactosyltransferase [Helicobacter mustelae 12198]SQH71840.1 lipopolysaccharide 1,3-galactosyltransferase [Helicobacter mustelae]
MFPIVFNVNQEYMKYMAVLCFSIIKNTKPSENKDPSHHRGTTTLEPYCFYVLTDGVDQQTQDKIHALEASLSAIYPCKILLHIISDKDFKGLPKLNGNYLTYFRIKLASLLPQDLKTCLYLDVDMLCLSDIRELFCFSLQDAVLGAVLDADFKKSRIMPARDSTKGSKKGFSLNVSCYFNAGLLLINLQEWRKQNIEQKCFDFLAQYHPICHDQDALNAVLDGNNIKLLPLAWNFMIHHLEAREYGGNLCFQGEGRNPTSAYKRAEYEDARKNKKILHFLTNLKPWKAYSITNNTPPLRFIHIENYGGNMH